MSVGSSIRRTTFDQAADRTSFLRLAETLTAFLQRLRVSAQSLEIADRQKIVRLVVRDILVDNNTITIRHSIPSHPRTPPTETEPPSDSRSLTVDESYLLRSERGEPSSGQSTTCRLNYRNRTELSLRDISRLHNPVLRGWVGYYGRKPAPRTHSREAAASVRALAARNRGRVCLMGAV